MVQPGRRPALKEHLPLPNVVANISGQPSTTSANSLSGALYRIQFIRESIINDPKTAEYAYRQGIASQAALEENGFAVNKSKGPDYISGQANDILQGEFGGNLADAFAQVSTYCQIVAKGLTSIVADSEIGTSKTLELAVTLSAFANDLGTCAKLAKTGELL